MSDHITSLIDSVLLKVGLIDSVVQGFTCKVMIYFLLPDVGADSEVRAHYPRPAAEGAEAGEGGCYSSLQGGEGIARGVFGGRGEGCVWME